MSGAPLRPLVLLDASLSMSAGGRWAEARDSAARWGEVRTFGDERSGADTAPSRGRSLLAPALVAASASDRPTIIVTDGEIEDAADLDAGLLTRTGVRLFPRKPFSDLAVVRVDGPSRVTVGDSIPLDVEIEVARRDDARHGLGARGHGDDEARCPKGSTGKRPGTRADLDPQLEDWSGRSPDRGRARGLEGRRATDRHATPSRERRPDTWGRAAGCAGRLGQPFPL